MDKWDASQDGCQRSTFSYVRALQSIASAHVFRSSGQRDIAASARRIDTPGQYNEQELAADAFTRMYISLCVGVSQSVARQAVAYRTTSLTAPLAMFARPQATFVYFLLSLSVLAAAMPNNPPPVTVTVTATAPAATVTTASECDTGEIQCCDSVESVSAP